MAFIAPNAKLHLEGFAGARLMGYLSSYEELDWQEERVDRQDLSIRNEDNVEVGFYDVHSDNITMIGDHEFTPDEVNYVLVDEQNYDRFAWSNKDEISTYYYEKVGVETVNGWTGDGFARTVVGVKGTLIPNDKVTISGGASLTIAPSPKDLGTYRGDNIPRLSSYFLDVEQNYYLATKAKFGQFTASGRVDYRFNAFGHANKFKFQLAYLMKKNRSVSIFFERSRAHDLPISGADNNDKFGFSLSGDVANFNIGVIRYPMNRMAIQGGANINIGKKKKETPKVGF